MKLYRVQANYKNIYIDEMLEAENDKAALEGFVKKVAQVDVTEREGPGFYNPDHLFLTFEEVDRDATTKVNIGETSIGVTMGNQSVEQGRVTPDMKWMDIKKIKDLRTKINDQSVEDAKKGLYDIAS